MSDARIHGKIGILFRLILYLQSILVVHSWSNHGSVELDTAIVSELYEIVQELIPGV